MLKKSTSKPWLIVFALVLFGCFFGAWLIYLAQFKNASSFLAFQHLLLTVGFLVTLWLLLLLFRFERQVAAQTRALSESANRFRLILENNEDVITLMDRDLKILYRSPSAYRATGWSPEEKEDPDRVEHLDPEDAAMLGRTIEELRGRPGLTKAVTIRFRHRDGSLHTFEGSVKNLLDEPGVNGILFNLRDVTEARRLEEATRRAQMYLRSSLESSRDFAIYAVDHELRYLYFNELHRQNMRHVHGSEPAIGVRITDLVPNPDLRLLAERNLEKALRGDAHVVITEIRSPRQEFFESRYSPVYDEQGQVAVATAFTMNVTERIRDEHLLRRSEAKLEEKVLERTEQLAKSHREMEAFTYSVSHDLRAPLRGVVGFTSILEEEYGPKLDEEGKRLIGVIRNNTLRMGQLIDELLNFSRVAKQDIVKSEVSMREVVEDIIGTLDNKNPKTDWDLRELPRVKADANTIRQVWMNLISNAVKYSGKEECPRIEINSYAERDQHVFYVRDNGVGFDEVYKEKLFKVFQRLHSSREFEGTGVGLAIVEKIVSKHGGRVWAEGEIDKGAIFYFSLPVAG